MVKRNRSVSRRKESKAFIESLQDAYLNQHVTFPTRHQHNQSSNILDLVITNENNMISNLRSQPPIGKSDHVVLCFNFNTYVDIYNSTHTVYQYHKCNFKTVKQEIIKQDWGTMFADKNIDETWELFCNTLLHLINENTPKTTIKAGTKIVNGKITQQTKMRKKQTAWKNYVNDKTDINYKKYTRARNQARWETEKLLKTMKKCCRILKK